MADPYATVDDFIEAFGTVEARRTANIDAPAVNNPDNDRMTEALEDASDEIDSYLQERYNVAGLRDDPPRRLKRICLDIARYTLTKNRPPEDYRLRYEDALKWLREAAAGKVSLGLTVTDEVTMTEGRGNRPFVVNGTGRVFTYDGMKSF
jgi:phage gp36-like protein